jgi:hypothetical protein
MQRLYRFINIIVICTIVTASPLSAQRGERVETPLWDTILRAHRVGWLNAPVSIQMMGVSTRAGLTQALKITATSREESVVELGTKKEVSTPTRFFKDDGDKSIRQETLSGFTQLDATGVFFVAQLRARAPKTETPVQTTFRNAKAWRIHVRGERSEVHYRQLKVNDECDVFVDDTGLLLGIARTFYKEIPMLTFTMELAFSDYRNTRGALLPYRIERYIKGQNVETILLDSYDFDVSVTPGLFEPRRSTR